MFYYIGVVTIACYTYYIGTIKQQTISNNSTLSNAYNIFNNLSYVSHRPRMTDDFDIFDYNKTIIIYLT